MIFVDSNIPMYLVGEPHPNQDALEQFLRPNIDEVFVTSAEVFQEIIHRYIAIDRRDAIDDCFDLLDSLVAQVYPITKADTNRARQIAHLQHRLTGRYCLHLAVMERFQLNRILTFDIDFDYWTGIDRLP